MLKNYFTIAWRSLLRNKGFSIINIFCLAVGITFTMLIGIYVLNERSVNSGIKNVADQYVIKSNWSHENLGTPITTLGPLAKIIKDEYPALVANYYRFDAVVNIVSHGDKHFRTQMAVGDTTLVGMYGFPLLYGDPGHAFRNQQSAVVTEDFARRFFGRANVTGEDITVQTPADGQKHTFVITAVLKRQPVNTVSGFNGGIYDVYLPMDANQYFQGGDKGDNWSNVYMVSMLQLRPGVTPKRMELPFAQTLNKYQPPFVKGNLKIELAPMRSYYLQQNDGELQKMLTTLSIIAIFILVLAVINFVNISIGTSAYRLKEIGLRKVFGGSRGQLVLQHLTEALILTSAAGILSIGFYEALLPLFNNMLNTTLPHCWLFGFRRTGFLVLVVLAVGLVSGAYPALVLSASNVITAIRGKMETAKGGLMLRKTLLVIQFSLAIVVFIGALTVSKQVSYFFNKDLGYNKDQVMVISSLPRQWDSTGVSRMETLKSQFLNVPGVQSVSLSYDIPDGNGGGNINVFSADRTGPSGMVILAADAGFAKVYGLRLSEGRFFREGDMADGRSHIILNETAMKTLGWTTAVGKTIHLGAANGLPETVIGVVKDFNISSLKEKIQPMFIAGVNEPFTRSYRYYSVKVDAAGIGNTISALERECKTLFPDAGFDYTFMDDKFQALYQSELQLKKAADVATGLNLVLVFTGIIGVLAFTLTRRTKEIAVRKVLGANARTIIFIFLKEYGLLILFSNLIAWPLAYLFTSNWLEGYAYRFQQNLSPYILVTVCMLITAFALITIQCYRSAMANPVKSLKTE